MSNSEEKKLIRDCIDSLTVYAAEVAKEDSESYLIDKVRSVVEDLVAYWGLDYGGDSYSAADYLRDFDSVIELTIAGEEDRTYNEDAVINGIYLYGMDMIASQGDDAKGDILSVCELVWDISEFYG